MEGHEKTGDAREKSEAAPEPARGDYGGDDAPRNSPLAPAENTAWRRFAAAFPLAAPQRLLILSFAAVILVGALVLRLPACQAAGDVGFLDALFTSTSAVCVTGLVTVDPGSRFNVLGQVVILLLFQAGGLGVMTFASLGLGALGARLSIQSQAALEDTLFQRDSGVDFRRAFRRIILVAVALELAGTAALGLCLLAAGSTPGHSLYSAMFHSISAFCNAGFSLYPDSLVALRARSPSFVLVVSVLIVLGGLGFTVLVELFRAVRDLLLRRPLQRPHRFSLHAAVVLGMTAPLLLGGTLLLLAFGLHEGAASTTLLDAWFQSVTARTAGFNTVDFGAVPAGSLLLVIGLMFVGGAPGSCAGGIKVTALAIWLARLRADIRGLPDVTLLGRAIPPDVVRRVSTLITLSLLFNAVGLLLLLQTELGTRGVHLSGLLFEQLSAFGTVGLSCNLTPKLSALGKLWIILTMFVGRLGPLTIAFLFAAPRRIHVRYPEGRVMIG